MTELHYLSLFVRAIAKVLLITGLGMGGALALIAECCGFRVVALGIEQVSERAVSRDTSKQKSTGNQPAPENSEVRMIVRARPKAVEDIPARYLCCEAARRAHERDTEEVFIETTLVTLCESRCVFCGTLQGKASGAQVVGEPKGNEILLECFELDEGETTSAEFLRHA